MSTETEQQETPVAGEVTQYYPSEGETDPYAFYVNGDRYTTFDRADVKNVEEGVVVRFRYVQNGKHRNVVPGSVEVIDADEPNVDDSTAGNENAVLPSTNAQIMSQSILRSAVFHHQHRDGSTVEDVVETAKQFADAQTELFRQLQNAEYKDA